MLPLATSINKLRLSSENNIERLFSFLQPYLSAKTPDEGVFLCRFLLEISFKWNDLECFGTIRNELEHHGIYWNVLGSDKSHNLYGKVFFVYKNNPKENYTMNKLRDDLYQRLHGFQPLKRSYKKQGQSDWYYLDPRGASTVGSMKQIDVADENAINPQINSILADDMAKNPNDYYIWRTRQDDKVRGKHAEREGKIFNKHIPPVGGNPGEDYNCRCWAEPYKPEKVEKLGITAKVDLSGLPQYAENDKANTANDVGYGKNEEKKPYMFSTEMRALLGYKESKNDYKAYNPSGGGIGALGMYQIRKDGLIDTGYLTKDNKWTGKNGIKSIEDFLNTPKVQEMAFDEYMKVQYRYLSHFGETKYVGAKFKGITSDFKVTDTGLLAAIHRTGIDYMNKFFKNIEKDKNGMYYMDYNKINNPDLKTKFIWIETRLREFEK